MRQGPHHVAQKSTTISSLFAIVVEKLLSFKIIGCLLDVFCPFAVVSSIALIFLSLICSNSFSSFMLLTPNMRLIYAWFFSDSLSFHTLQCGAWSHISSGMPRGHSIFFCIIALPVL